MSCYSLNTAAKPGISFRKAIPQLVFVEVFLFVWFGFLGVFSFFLNEQGSSGYPTGEVAAAIRCPPLGLHRQC